MSVGEIARSKSLATIPDGYLWIATLDGLVRFDGASLRRFSRSDHPELGSNRILALHVDREGSLWIGTEDGGAARMKDGSFRSFGAAEGLAGTFVTAFAEDGEGKLWAATSAGLERFDGERWSVPEEGRPRAGESAIPFVVGRVRTGETLHLLEPGGRFVDYPWPEGADSRNYALGRDPRGGVWLRTGDRAFLEFRGGTATPFELPFGSRTGDLPCITGGVEVALTDHDVEPFDLTRAPDGDVTLPIEQRRPGGLGIHLTRRLVEGLEYQYAAERREARITFRKTAPAGAAADGAGEA